MIATIVLFILCIIFVFYLPGKLLLRIAKFSFSDFAITIATSMSLGICFFLLLAYIFAWLGASMFGGYIMLFLSMIEVMHIFKNKGKIEIYRRNIISTEMIEILIGTITMTYLMWWSGMLTKSGLAFYSINATDAFYHLSLIGNLMHHFPPTHAGLDGISLRGYHFFYDFLLANFSTLFDFDTADLYFRLFPFFFAFFYGISGFALARFLHISRLSTKIFLFLLYFANSFGFFLTAYFHHEYSTGIIQSMAHILDPNVIFSVGVLFTIFIFIFNARTFLHIVLTGIVIGVLSDIKIYTAIIAFSALFSISIVSLLRDKKSIYLKILFASGIVGSLIYLPINYGVGKLIFAPFLLYKHFMESTFLFSSFQWALKDQFYTYNRSYPHLVALYIIAFSIFFIPSLGIRIVSFVYLPKLLQKKFYTPQNIFWLVGISIAFLIPSFFIQDTAVFVIIQFLWFGYILLLLPTSIVLGKMLNKAHILVILLFFGLLTLLSIPDIFIVIKTFTQNPTIVSSEMVNMANFIREKIPQEKGVLSLNRDRQQNSDIFMDLYAVPIVSALSMHAIYYEPEVLDFKAVESIVSERKNIIDMMQKITYTCDNPSTVNEKITTLMKNTNNQYILIFKNSSCFNKLHNFVKVHTEGELALYKL